MANDDLTRLIAEIRTWIDPIMHAQARSEAGWTLASRGGQRIRLEELDGVLAPTQITLPMDLVRETAQEVARDAWAGGLVTSDALFRNVSLVFIDLMGNPVGALQGNGNWYTRGSFVVENTSGQDRIVLYNTGEITALNASGAARFSAYGTSGLLALRNASAVDQVVLRSDGTASRFAVIPVVGPADGSADKRLLTFDDLGGVGGGATNLTTTRDATSVTVASDTGTDAVLAVVTTALAGVMSGADKLKLNGIATGATANSSDAFLRSRGNHTGTQTADTISDLAEAVDDRVAALIVAGSGMTRTYDDAAGTLTLTATGGGAGTRDYPITYVSPTAPTSPRVGDFWVELPGRPVADDPHAELIVSSTAPASPGIGTLWVQA